MDGSEAVAGILKHYGVPGMKWGVRRTAAQLKKDAPEKDSSSDGDKASKSTTKKGSSSSRTDASKLSDTELRGAVERMRLEQEFKRLSPEPVKRGQGFVGNLMRDIGKTEVTRVAKGAASIAVEQALKKQGREDIANRIMPKKSKKG